MRRFLSRSIAAGVVAAGVTGIGFAYPDLVSEAGLDLWNLPKLNSQVDANLRREAELGQQVQSTLTRLTAKAAVVNELRDGSLTLREAAIRFRNLNSQNPNFVSMMQLSRPAANADECQYWNVIDF